jgi:hypothetical protein
MPPYDEIADKTPLLVGRYNELTSVFDLLSTFSEADQWDADASALIRLVTEEISDYLSFRESEIHLLENILAARNSKSFAAKIFASKSEENSHKENIKKIDKAVNQLESLMENLNSLIDRTPNSKAEQKEMIDELKALKKELTLEKKEINEAIRQTNVEARKSMASVTGLRGGFVGDIARYKRISTRLEKEAALKPNEDAKAIINRKLLQIDKNINWVSKFKGDELPTINSITNSILRCAYCGRAVIEGEICLGCGSTQTILSPK